MHAASPLVLISTASDPNEDLNFAVFVCWFYVPLALFAVLALDAWRRSMRK